MHKPATKYSLLFLVIMMLMLSRFTPRASRAEEQIRIKIDYVAEYNRITKPPNYDPNDNAAKYYIGAFETLVDIPDDIRAIRKAWPGDMNETEINSLKNWLALNKELIPHLKSAAQKPHYWIQRDAENNFLLTMEMPDLRKFRTATYLLSFEAKLVAVQDQTRASLQNICAMYEMGAHLKGPKTLVEQLTGIAIRDLAAHDAFQVIDRANVSSDLLQDFQNRFKVLAANQTYTIFFTTEKFIVYDMIQRMFTDDGEGGGHIPEFSPYQMKNLSDDQEHQVAELFYQLTEQQRHDWKMMDRLQTTQLTKNVFEYLDNVANKTPGQFNKEGTALIKILEGMTAANPLLNILTSALDRPIELSFRSKAHVDALITTIAILRYKADKIQLLDSLEQLISSGYLKELPMDPYSDGPLVYKRVDGNFTLYSLGADFDDDGGTPSKWGEGQEGGDQVFWPVERY
jgi:hypothetical protein